MLTRVQSWAIHQSFRQQRPAMMAQHHHPNLLQPDQNRLSPHGQRPPGSQSLCLQQLPQKLLQAGQKAPWRMFPGALRAGLRMPLGLRQL